MHIESPAEHNVIPGRVWVFLAALVAYIAAMYGWVARIYIHYSVVGIPWLLRQPGYRLYENVADQHAPGSIWLNALLCALLPGHLLRARLSMIVLMALCIVLIFWLARRWWGLHAGLAGAALFAAWGPVIMDRPMYYEVVLALLVLAAVAVWHRSEAPWWRPVLAGLLIGLGVLVKQQGLAVLAVFVIWRLLSLDFRTALPDVGRFVLAAGVVVGLVALVFAIQGRLDDALFWIWTFNTRPGYADSTRQAMAAREAVLLAGWLALVPLFALFVIPRREQWRREGILLLGLLPALCTPAYPRYARFHLSGAVPVVALIGTGALAYALEAARRGGALKRWLLRAYIAGAAALLLVAFALPTYYRLKLGPRVGEYEALIPIGEWLAENTDAQPGTRVWLLPGIDPTDNFYAINGYPPPTYWVQTYKWYHSVPGLTGRVIDALDADRPRYAILIERWHDQVPDGLLEYLEAHYVPIGEMEVGHEYGKATFYALAP